jgi:hypothetical protein
MNFALCRVIGNELPPRDAPGEKLRSLQRILERDESAARVWVLNHLHDPTYRQQVLALLQQHRETFQELRFDPSRYFALTTLRERVCYAININRARNLAIDLARPGHEFIVCLDQDCLFTRRSWAATVAYIANDQKRAPDRKYYGLIMRRMVRQNGRYRVTRVNQEPQIVFRQDALQLFDPDRPFGDNDKVALLQSLGYGPGPEYAIHGDTCRTAGYVVHLPSGDDDAEVSFPVRWRKRQASIANLLQRIQILYGDVMAVST